MAIIEGRGRVAPAPQIVRLDERDWEWIDRVGHLRAKKYEKSTNSYSRGLIGNSEAHVRGVAGEYAMSLWMNAELKREAMFRMDDSDVADGGWDFDVLGKRIDVKASKKADDMLITRVRNGCVRPLKADIYAAVQVDRPLGFVRLLGWIRRADLEGLARSPIGEHWNIKVPASELLPMRRLVQLFSSKLKAGAA